ncbi:UDP-N-acetylmuramyl pentapeptide phosphotransferase/UDP-N-acetylglucosamine-1-phosphate transferase [Flavobacterium sp. CG_9.1]|uniref:MraY family glycosyltransferase n=1 Tax=Flavobacterium sp. CG_9.1 TaxID=2787728 RepID=UPI0018CADE62|nr:glycosyltransferase family 4 protein [Flavobacterium sp. CG_9.1]MBG6062552.1 UDP-N-acetylmuramyl pentapeptide phosphotransferase/UDP-N-acetylglucosamine-1-phosphate transferase [Flavobacterium sp. CG_9.1]
MHYTLITFILFLAALVYFKIADVYNIIDKPNHRSAHTEITIRGGGVLFWFAALFYFAQHSDVYYLFFTGITIVSMVSFWDDIQSLPNKIRILAHFSAISLLFYNLNVFEILPWWGILLTYIAAIGIINAYNFMDGINGMTGLYTIVVLGSLWYVNHYVFEFIDGTFIIYPILASIVFLFFNYRKRAKCFAGDVGSISIAFWIIYLILKLILDTESLVWLLFLGVYGVETVATILHRIYLKENIFEAHRWHLYQVLSNGYKMQHRLVSFLYAFLQMVISTIVITTHTILNDFILFAIVLVPLSLLYCVKFYLLKKISY